jgi:transposase
MDRDRLKGYLDEGLSLAQIGALENRHPSTIRWWLNRYGLEPNGRKHGRRTSIDAELLQALSDEGLPVREIASRVGVSPSTANRAMLRLGIVRRSGSRRAEAVAARKRGEKRFTSTCRRHGVTEFLALPGGRSRCARCNSEAVARWRRRIKRVLVEEAGGACVLCGFDEHVVALQFHHRDPEQKAHGIAEAGATRSLARARREAEKCVLLCANCHAQVEAGVKCLPVELGESRIRSETTD